MATVRLADLLSGLSRLADLGFGLPAGEALRSAALATTLGRSLDLSGDDVRASLYTAMLLHAGCTGYAHEAAQAVGTSTPGTSRRNGPTSRTGRTCSRRSSRW